MGEGPLLVLLHGIGGNRLNWQLQLPAFAGDFMVAAWDARGYGLSQDYDGDLNFSDFSHDLARLLDHFGATKAHLCGLSMGGHREPDWMRRAQDEIFRYCVEGKVRIPVQDSFPLEDYIKAFDVIRHRQVRGKIVLRIKEDS